jgi:hypothetical protein
VIFPKNCAHLELEADRLRSAGFSEEDARRAAAIDPMQALRTE